jgi:hypothetical protein
MKHLNSKLRMSCQNSYFRKGHATGTFHALLNVISPPSTHRLTPAYQRIEAKHINKETFLIFLLPNEDHHRPLSHLEGEWTGRSRLHFQDYG